MPDLWLNTHDQKSILLTYCFLFVLVAMGTTIEETYSDITEEDHPPHLDYKSKETIISPALNSLYRAVIDLIKNSIT